MFKTRTHTLSALVVLTILLSKSASSAIVTYEFTVTGGFGPLGDVVTQGYFSFDDSLQPPPGQDFLVGFDLLDDLHFVWNGVTYDETTANTGGMRFDEDGDIELLIFGNNCPNLGSCSVTILQDTWNIGIGFTDDSIGGNILYTVTEQTGMFFSDITAVRVPVPGAVVLMISALGVMSSLYRPAN